MDEKSATFLWAKRLKFTSKSNYNKEYTIRSHRSTCAKVSRKKTSFLGIKIKDGNILYRDTPKQNQIL